MIASLLTIAAGLAWLQATPAQRHQWQTRLHSLFAPTAVNTMPAPRPRPAPAHSIAAVPIVMPANSRANDQPEHSRYADESADISCGQPPTLSVSEVQASNVYQFVANDGVVSFTDI